MGVVHGAGGSAGVGLLILAAIPDHATALLSLGVFALSAALAMGAVAAGLGRVLRNVPSGVTGAVIATFGGWYLTAAAAGAPYPF